MNPKLKKLIPLVIVLILVIVGFTYCQSQQSKMEALNYPNATWEQLDKPKEGQEIAVVDTTEGVFKIALYRDNAPDTVKRFVDLCNEGFYDNKYVYQISDGQYMMFGTTKKDGVIIQKDEVIKEGDDSEKRKYTQRDYDVENTKYDNEITDKMWPFKGAVMSMGPDTKENGAFICILDNYKLSDKQIENFKKAKDTNIDLVNKFLEVGGIPQFAQHYTFFGQTYEGLDVVEKINSAKADKNGHPSEEIKINSIKIETYSAN